MKKIAFLLISVSLFFGCLDGVITTESETVCCRMIYINTLDLQTREIDFDVYKEDKCLCVYNSDEFVVGQIIDDSYCQ